MWCSTLTRMKNTKTLNMAMKIIKQLKNWCTSLRAYCYFPVDVHVGNHHFVHLMVIFDSISLISFNIKCV